MSNRTYRMFARSPMPYTVTGLELDSMIRDLWVANYYPEPLPQASLLRALREQVGQVGYSIEWERFAGMHYQQAIEAIIQEEAAKLREMMRPYGLRGDDLVRSAPRTGRLERADYQLILSAAQRSAYERELYEEEAGRLDEETEAFWGHSEVKQLQPMQSHVNDIQRAITEYATRSALEEHFASPSAFFNVLREPETNVAESRGARIPMRTDPDAPDENTMYMVARDWASEEPRVMGRITGLSVPSVPPDLTNAESIVEPVHVPESQRSASIVTFARERATSLLMSPVQARAYAEAGYPPLNPPSTANGSPVGTYTMTVERIPSDLRSDEPVRVVTKPARQKQIEVQQVRVHKRRFNFDGEV